MLNLLNMDCRFLILLSTFFFANSVFGVDGGLLAWWGFDEGDGQYAQNSVDLGKDVISGHFEWADGVAGKALRTDENSTYIQRNSGLIPDLQKDFTVQAWVALRAYPWNWCPIIMQKDGTKGFFFGVDFQGRVGLHVGNGQKWTEFNSAAALPGLNYDTSYFAIVPQEEKDKRQRAKFEGSNIETPSPSVALLSWNHLAASFQSNGKVTIYVNGNKISDFDTGGTFTPAGGADIHLMRSPEAMTLPGIVRPGGNKPVWYSLDGLIDEVKIHGRALSADEILKEYRAVQPKTGKPLEFRKLPTGGNEPGRFGAYYTKLDYDNDWDMPRREGEYRDVVVRFDEYPFKLVCWTGYIYPIIFTENGIGVMHEAYETWTQSGCHEAMMDRQNRYSTYRVIENNDARVVLHWRHALVDFMYNMTNVDPASGWGDWVDDYYTIYPDGVIARTCKIWGIGHGSFAQDNFILPIGKRPVDVFDINSVILVNEAGDAVPYKAGTGKPVTGNPPADPVAQYYNTKSIYKPFMIVEADKGYGPQLRPMSWPTDPSPWCWPWWSHWPVSQYPSDGLDTYVQNGRPTSSSLTAGLGYEPIPGGDKGDRTMTQWTLIGMTDKPAAELARISKSWSHAPDIEVVSTGFANEGYDIRQRCYVLQMQDKAEAIEFELKASTGRPVFNPAFIIKGWGDMDAELKINGQSVKRGKEFRYGFRYGLNGTDIVLWLKLESEKGLNVYLNRAKSKATY